MKAKQPASIKFSKILVIQSLRGGDSDTGRQLSEYVQPIAFEHGICLEFKTCLSADDFLKILEDVESFSNDGGIPLLHIECHGDDSSGLEFSDGSCLDWSGLSSAILPINVNTGLNLICVISACYGAYLAGNWADGLVEVRSPFRAMIGPTSVMRPDEALRGFMSFYDILLSSGSFYKAQGSLKKQKPQYGYWSVVFAETIYSSIVSKYIAEHCGDAQIKKRAKEMSRASKSTSKHKSVGSFRRSIRSMTKELVPGTYFDVFFSIDRIPGSSDRFNSFRRQIINLSRSL